VHDAATTAKYGHTQQVESGAACSECGQTVGTNERVDPELPRGWWLSTASVDCAEIPGMSWSAVDDWMWSQRGVLTND
jgi:hypothetical protein